MAAASMGRAGGAAAGGCNPDLDVPEGPGDGGERLEASSEIKYNVQEQTLGSKHLLRQ